MDSIIFALRDIKECLLADEPVDAFVERWAKNNPDVPDARKVVRTVYAGELEKAEAILRSLL